jgi:tetratricopeptide (TPR) repeat protein
MRVRLALACLLLSGAAVTAQEAATSSVTVPVTDTQAAQLLLAANRPDDARHLLERILTLRPEDNEALFLLASVAVAQKDYDTAISLYRRILVRTPEAERVRLDLARAFYLKGDYDNAERQFRFARAGDIDDTVKTNIDHFLSAIERLREWSLNFALALAPDTNQNAATAADHIDIYGAPFLLGAGARRQSGLGLAGNVAAEWSPLLGGNLKARVGGYLSRTDYGGGQFDDMTFAGYAGPQWLFDNWDAGVLLTGFERWYANRSYLHGIGGKLTADYGITSAVLLGTTVGVQSLSDDFIPEQGGPLWTAQFQASYVLSPSSLFQVQLGLNRQEAGLAAYAYTGLWFGAGYQQDLPLGFSAGIQPGYLISRYDDALAAFGKVRADDSWIFAVTLLNRRFDYHGFTPLLSWTYTNQHSNIALYSYSRSQFQLGLTSRF